MPPGEGEPHSKEEQEEEEVFEGIEVAHTVNLHKYGLEVLLTMNTWISRTGRWEKRNPSVRVEALADSGSSVSILSFDLAGKIKMKTPVQDTSGNDMDVSGGG